jgi:ABC-type branched-subunit amino acid transport system substrate-binding protein
MKKLLFVTLVVVLLAGLILGGCAKPAPTTPTTPTPTPPPAPQKVLKFGGTYALNRPEIVPAPKWGDLLAKLINDQGGWKIGGEKYKVEFINYDDQGDQAKAKNNLEKLVLQDGCKFILGGTPSAGVDITVTEPNKVICVGSDFTNASSDPKVQYYYTTGNYFNNALVYVVCQDVAAKGVKSYVSVKPDTQMGHFIDGIINGTWKLAAPDVKYLGTVYFDPSTADYGPIATKAISLNPDCVDLIYIGLIPNAVPQAYSALKDVGFKGIVLPGIVDDDTVVNLVTTVGKEFVEGGESFSTDARRAENQDPRMLAFIDDYIKEYGKLEAAAASGPSLGWFILEDAINATQSVDVDTIKAYLDNSKGSVRHASGWAKLFARPDLKNYRTICGGYSHPVIMIHDGKLVTVGTVTLKDQYLFAILSGGLVDTYKKYWEEYGYPAFPAEEKGKSKLNFSDLGITGHD